MKWVQILVAMAATAITVSVPARGDNRLDDQSERSHQEARQIVDALLVESPYRMSLTARGGTIRYTLAWSNGGTWQTPATFEQRVEQAPEGIRVTICSDCGNEEPPGNEDLARYIQPNEWVDSDDPAVVNFARRHGRGGSVARTMRRLVKAVQEHMTGPIDFRHYYSASRALETRTGDCTEFALLLAAAARARGIPARLAYGIAYSSRFTGRTHVFSPHVWVQVWDGERWQSYDAGLGQFDAGSIALYVGDGSIDALPTVNQAIAGMSIVDAAEVRNRTPTQ